MLWLCAYFPQLGLEVCGAPLSAQPQPTAEIAVATAADTQAIRPCVLLADNRVMQRNPQAQQRGIHIGTSLAAAHSIAADLVHVQRNPAAETERLNYLSQVLYGFSSQVCIDSTPGGYLDYPNNIHHSVLLEISASLRLFGGLQQLLQRVHQQLGDLQHDALLQVAPTPLAALSGARWQLQGSTATVLCDTLKPLHSMPLDCLALSERQGESLHNMGLRNCGALLRLPARELGQRFGKTLGIYLQRLTGTAPDPRRPIDPPREFASSIHLLEACTSKTALLFPIKRLCNELGHWLIAQQLGVCLLRWEFANHNNEANTFEVRISRASQSTEQLLRLTQLQLERCELPRDVLDIRLVSVELEAWQNHSDSLFPELSNPSHTNNDGSLPLSELLDQLRARLGPDICSGLSEQPRHRPEDAWQAEPLTRLQRTTRSSRKKRRANTTANSPGNRAKNLNGESVTNPATANSDKDNISNSGIAGKYRPLWLLPTPQPISRHTLNLLYGPERLQGSWWQSQRLCRDYYVAQSRQQQRSGSYSWVFCERERWFVHGYFG